MKTNYYEAKALADLRNKKWSEYYESQGKHDLEQCVLNAPEGIYSYNVVSRAGGWLLAGESDKGVYEYYAGLLAFSGPIPDEAYVSEEALNHDSWEVISRRETFDW